MHKKRLVISSIFVLLIIAGIGIIFFSKNYGQSNTVVRVQTVNINSKAKKIANYDVLANGKTRESHSTGDFSTAERIKVSPNIFDTYTKKNQTHLRLLKEVPLYNQKKHKVDDANYWKMINSITKNVHADIYKLTLFKAHNSYYAYVQINQWILDAGTLYEYNPKSNILRKLCDFDGKEVINISH